MIELARADTHPAWCPGCGNYLILKAFNAAVAAAGVDPDRLVLVSGIGQAAKFPHYPATAAHVFNGLHGRALPAATGIKLANTALKVVVTSGDGDMYGEGGNHFLHAVRRNVSVAAFVHDNRVYGLTKGQASPTSPLGFVTKAQPHGVTSQPLNPLALAILGEASFVARACCLEAEHLQAMMTAALAVEEGFALLDILQTCPSFNRVNTAAWYRERVRPIGPEHDPTDRDAALTLACAEGETLPIGVFYRGARPGYESTLPVLRHGPLAR